MNELNFKLGMDNEEFVKNEFIKILNKKKYEIVETIKAPKRKFYDWDYKLKLKVKDKVKNLKIEIKTDTLISETDNFYIEYMNTNQNETSGIFKSKAHYLLYYDINNKFIYCFNICKLKDYIKNNKYKLIETGNNQTGDDNARGYLIYKPLIESNNNILNTFKI